MCMILGLQYKLPYRLDTPMQLVFGRDTVLNTKFKADWKYMRVQKKKLIEQNNTIENAKQK
jgi:hypothetical protein